MHWLNQRWLVICLVQYLRYVVIADDFFNDSFPSSGKVLKSKYSSIVDWQFLKRIPRRRTETFQTTISTMLTCMERVTIQKNQPEYNNI